MKRGGIDIGSRFIKYVLVDELETVSFYKEETGHNPLSVCYRLLDCREPDSLVATGYGRYLLEVQDNVKTITEIKAVARGAKEIFPSCRTVIDIGGQDTKVINLKEEGGVKSFEMNDRCAAGTGRFLEIMAKALGYDISDFGKDCNEGGGNGISISSMCAVFAESEVISLINRGIKREKISYSIHHSIVQRVISLAHRNEINGDVVFAGGCARNQCLVTMFEHSFHKRILVHENPDMLAALGAALH